MPDVLQVPGCQRDGLRMFARLLCALCRMRRRIVDSSAERLLLTITGHRLPYTLLLLRPRALPRHGTPNTP